MAKTTSNFNSDRTIRQYAYGLLLESPFVASSTDCWAERAKIRQKRPSRGRRGKTGSRNMAATQKNQLFDPGFLFTPSDSFSLGRTVLPQYKTSQTDRRQTDDTVCQRLNRWYGQPKTVAKPRYSSPGIAVSPLENSSKTKLSRLLIASQIDY